jgi:hypothetical protein
MHGFKISLPKFDVKNSWHQVLLGVGAFFVFLAFAYGWFSFGRFALGVLGLVGMGFVAILFQYPLLGTLLVALFHSTPVYAAHSRYVLALMLLTLVISFMKRFSTDTSLGNLVLCCVCHEHTLGRRL